MYAHLFAAVLSSNLVFLFFFWFGFVLFSFDCETSLQLFLVHIICAGYFCGCIGHVCIAYLSAILCAHYESFTRIADHSFTLYVQCIIVWMRRCECVFMRMCVCVDNILYLYICLYTTINVYLLSLLFHNMTLWSILSFFLYYMYFVVLLWTHVNVLLVIYFSVICGLINDVAFFMPS